MFYRLYMSDEVCDQNIVVMVEADDVFDAINKVTKVLAHPSATKLIEACPLELEKEK